MQAAMDDRPYPRAMDGFSEPEEAPTWLPPSTGLSTVEAGARLARYGANTLPLIAPTRWQLLVGCCVRGPMTSAAWALLLALLILTQRWVSALCVSAALLCVGGCTFCLLQQMQDTARHVLEAQRQRPTAVAYRDGRWQQTPPSQLVPGDLVRLQAGSVVPADCTIDAVLEVNEGMLTGESLPVAMGPESVPKMGSLIVQGQAHGTVQLTGRRTFSGRLIQLLQHAPQTHRAAAARQGKSGGLHATLVRVMVIMTTAVAALGLLLAGFAMGYRKVGLATALEAVVLVALASLPLGVEAMVAGAVAAGARCLVQGSQMLPVRLSALSSMASMDMLFVDKTGTLTTNALELQEECHLLGGSRTRAELLQLAALSLRWREPPVDPLDAIILSAADLSLCDAYTQLDFMPFTASTGRTEATVRAPDGAVFRVAKGRPSAVMRLVQDHERWRAEVKRLVADVGLRGLRCLLVARTTAERTDTAGAAAGVAQEPLWQLAGMLTFLDPLRADAVPALQRLEACGVTVKVITGDHPLITKEVARRLGLGNVSVASSTDVFPHRPTVGFPDMRDTAPDYGITAVINTDGDPAGLVEEEDASLGENYGALLRSFSAYAEALPQHKYLAVEVARQCGHMVGFLGDGINDAPALQHADVGIALLTEDCTAGLEHAEGNRSAAPSDEDAALLAAAVETAPWVGGYAAGAASASWAPAIADAVALTPSLHKVADAILHSRAALQVVESVLRFRVGSSAQLALTVLLNPFIALSEDPRGYRGGEWRRRDGGGGDSVESYTRPLRLPPLAIAFLTAFLTLLGLVGAVDSPPPLSAMGRPHQWNVAAVALAMGPVVVLGVTSSLLLQWVLADSVRDVNGSWCHAVGVPPVPAENAAAALTLHVALSLGLIFLSYRAPATTFCWLHPCRPRVALAVVGMLGTVTALAAVAPGVDVEPPRWPLAWWTSDTETDSFVHPRGLALSSDPAIRLLLLWVWMWALWWWWLQELARVGTARLLRRFDILQLRTTMDGARPPRPDGESGGSPWWRPQQQTGGSGISLGALDFVEQRLVG